MRRRLFVPFTLLLAALPALAQQAPSTPPSAIYGVIFGVLFDESGNVRQLRVMRVFEPRRGNVDPVDMAIPDSYVAAVKRMLESPRYRPKPDMIKPEEVYAYFFYDPAQPERADYDPRPKSR